jgi:uncharacterized protein (TIGR03084 family)
MSDIDQLRADLAAEQAALDAVIEPLREDQWRTPTPSPGWSVQDQVGHLTFFDGTAALAVSDPEGFAAGVAALIEAAGTVGVDEFTLGNFRRMAPPEVLELWRMNRRRLDEAASRLPEDARVPWYGPSMGARSFLTARLMEVWAHGTDIVDAVGGDRPATDRLRHIAQLGYITRGWSYRVRGLEVPEGEVRVVLSSPSGATWTFGPEPAAESATGSAEDFCLVVTQRRHLDDTDLVVTPLARDWLLRAQAFAGGPSEPPAPGRR